MALRVCGTSVLFAILSAQFAAAQVRQISGRVTNTQTQEGVPEATVAVIGTEIVAQTNNQGIYQLNAPDGDVTLVVRAIGFKRQQLAVPALQPTADVALEPDVFNLQEIVITGQATGQERQQTHPAERQMHRRSLRHGVQAGKLESLKAGEPES